MIGILKRVPFIVTRLFASNRSGSLYFFEEILKNRGTLFDGL